jgi:hypothetical protein
MTHRTKLCLAESSPLRRSLMPSGSRLVHDSRLIVEPREIAAGGLTGTFGARVQSVLERQHARGQISGRQREAGERLYRCWALGVAGARSDSKGCSAWSPGGFSDCQLDALQVYRGARDAIGAARWPLLFSVVVEDWTVQRYANERGRNRDGTAEVLRSALDDLADYLRLPKGG